MKKLIVVTCLVLLFIPTFTFASVITIGSVTFERGEDNFADAAVRISGSGGAIGLDCETALSDLDYETGCFNLDSNDVFRLDFDVAFSNQSGDDLYFTDARFSADAVDFSMDGVNFFTIAAAAFTDTGISGALSGRISFDLFAVTLDLSNYGFSNGGVFNSIWIRGVFQSDPTLIANLNKGIANNVPTPNTLSMLLLSLIALGFSRKVKN